MESDGEVKMKKVLSLLIIISEVTERERQTWKHSPQVFLGAKLGMQKKGHSGTKEWVTDSTFIGKATWIWNIPADSFL